MNPQPAPTFIPVTNQTLMVIARTMHQQGYRLAQISATRLTEQVELTYSFAREQRLLNYRLLVPCAGGRLPSISSVYWCAFLYENEIHDLFGVPVDGLVVDFHGNLYKTAVKYPFAQASAPPAKNRRAASPVAPATPPTAAIPPANNNNHHHELRLN